MHLRSRIMVSHSLWSLLNFVRRWTLVLGYTPPRTHSHSYKCAQTKTRTLTRAHTHNPLVYKIRWCLWLVTFMLPWWLELYTRIPQVIYPHQTGAEQKSGAVWRLWGLAFWRSVTVGRWTLTSPLHGVKRAWRERKPLRHPPSEPPTRLWSVLIIKWSTNNRCISSCGLKCQGG